MSYKCLQDLMLILVLFSQRMFPASDDFPFHFQVLIICYVETLVFILISEKSHLLSRGCWNPAFVVVGMNLSLHHNSSLF